MVYRVFVEKKKELAQEAKALLGEARDLLGIKNLTDVRVINRYDAENITPELFDYAKRTVFSEPQLDIVSDSIEINGKCFAVEFLPGQFDQRADSAAQCIQIISQGERPLIRTAKIYILIGDITDADAQRIKKYVINPVEAREASLEKPETLAVKYDIPTEVRTLDGFIELDRAGLEKFVKQYGLAMDADDIAFCQDYFKSEHRDPTITEIRMIDTYWSDHCRHTTFLTVIDSVKFEDELLQSAYDEYLAVRKELGRTKPICLMDLATIAVKYLKKHGKLDRLDESEEINACTVKIDVEVDGVTEPWLLLFKNETHNHPTEIEPFGGAATCIGGAIRDPLSGRSYVYGAMRVTGAADPLKPIDETIKGKLPQRKIVTTAAAGYSSYGNQIGLATGIVDEIYHPGYAAKRMEIGAVIAATPAENVRREVPAPGDIVILLGGSTGRDGCGGATGSSKSHTVESLESCGAEVQKGNAPEERKLQRLFRNKEACLMIKRCNDFGAGGVSVAIGELADGLEIDLNAVPKKYEGLDGTELAISESQERMAVVVEPHNVDAFLALANKENLQAVPVAKVQADPRLVMNWNGKKIVDISREFLNSNGADKHIDITPEVPALKEKEISGSFAENYSALASDLNICSKRGLSERFDSTIGAGTVLMPFGGKNQLTPIQAMVQKISVEKKHTDDCSLMAFGYNPFITEQSPYHGAYLAVIESVCKLIASGAEFKDVYLTFQEYFERPGRDGKRWGQPLAALLGAFKAQMELGIGSIGGKDSMSGSFENLDVPPTLVSFAVTTEKTSSIVSPEFKSAGHKVVFIAPESDENGLPKTDSLIDVFSRVTGLLRSGKAVACYTPGMGGIAEAVMKMAFGNGIGFEYSKDITLEKIFGLSYAGFILELANGAEETGTLLGHTNDSGCISLNGESIALSKLRRVRVDGSKNSVARIFPSHLWAYCSGCSMIAQAVSMSSMISCGVNCIMSIRCFISRLTFCLDPALVGGVFAEGQQPRDVGLGDVALLRTRAGDGVQIREAHVFDLRGGEPLHALFHAVGKDAHDAEHLRAGLPQHVHDLKDTAARGDQILHHDDLLALFQPPFDLVLAAVVLAGRAHIAHGKAHHMADDGGVGDAGRGRAHEHLRLRILAPDRLGDGALDQITRLGRGQDEAVVAVDGALDAAGPRERLLRAQKHCLDREQAARNFVFDIHSSSSC